MNLLDIYGAVSLIGITNKDNRRIVNGTYPARFGKDWFPYRHKLEAIPGKHIIPLVNGIELSMIVGENNQTRKARIRSQPLHAGERALKKYAGEIAAGFDLGLAYENGSCRYVCDIVQVSQVFPNVSLVMLAQQELLHEGLRYQRRNQSFGKAPAHLY